MNNLIVKDSIVWVKSGATVWMKSNGYWLNEWPKSIDGMMFRVVADYTHLAGSDSHWWLENDLVKDCGVNPRFVELVNQKVAE